jgi:hypothetical protein
VPTRPTKPNGAAGAKAAPAQGAPQAEAGAVAPEDEAFTLWLRRSLRECHDSIAAEPIPEDLLRLIEEDRAERERIRGLRARTRR